jgi:hypothetical protein
LLVSSTGILNAKWTAEMRLSGLGLGEVPGYTATTPSTKNYISLNSLLLVYVPQILRPLLSSRFGKRRVSTSLSHAFPNEFLIGDPMKTDLNSCCWC